MHTVVLLAHALNLAERLGYVVRQEWLDGSGGGCELRGKKFLFIDLATSPADQLEVVLRLLRGEPGVLDAAMPRELRDALKLRKIA
jgi:hypothetical protein